jgi:hypothetical protein
MDNVIYSNRYYRRSRADPPDLAVHDGAIWVFTMGKMRSLNAGLSRREAVSFIPLVLL